MDYKIFIINEGTLEHYYCKKKIWKGEKIKSWLKRGERSDIYQTQVCRLPQSIKCLERIDMIGAFGQHYYS